MHTTRYFPPNTRFSNLLRKNLAQSWKSLLLFPTAVQVSTFDRIELEILQLGTRVIFKLSNCEFCTNTRAVKSVEKLKYTANRNNYREETSSRVTFLPVSLNQCEY